MYSAEERVLRRVVSIARPEQATGEAVTTAPHLVCANAARGPQGSQPATTLFKRETRRGLQRFGTADNGSVLGVK